MLFQTGKLQYNENGAYIDLVEPNLISCDVWYVNGNSRGQKDRHGIWTNESIDSIQINIKRGVYTLLDGCKENIEVPLRFSNGAFAVSGPFILASKKNYKDKDGNQCIFMSFYPNQNGKFVIAARGGEGGHVDDVEQDGVSVVKSGVAEITTAQYAKKTDVATDLNRKLSLSGGTMDRFAQVSMHSGRIVDLAEPTGPTHAATKKYVDENSSKDRVPYANSSTSKTFKLGIDSNGFYWEE